MSPTLIENAIRAILVSGPSSDGERRLLERLRAVRDALCARPDCTMLCNAECRQTRRATKLRF
ncbi:MAG TPA: hypothetical protein VGE72_24095 [Azospirillum sp.]